MSSPARCWGEHAKAVHLPGRERLADEAAQPLVAFALHYVHGLSAPFIEGPVIDAKPLQIKEAGSLEMRIDSHRFCVHIACVQKDEITGVGSRCSPARARATSSWGYGLVQNSGLQTNRLTC